MCAWDTWVKRHTKQRAKSGHFHTHTNTLLTHRQTETHTDICWCSANSEVLEVTRQRPLLWLTGCHHQEIKQQNPDNNTHNNHQADWVRVTHTHTHTHTEMYIDTVYSTVVELSHCVFLEAEEFLHLNPLSVFSICRCEHLSNDSVFKYFLKKPFRLSWGGWQDEEKRKERKKIW